MNFLSGQDDSFETGNQPISVRHLSQPYNKAKEERQDRDSCLAFLVGKAGQSAIF